MVWIRSTWGETHLGIPSHGAMLLIPARIPLCCTQVVFGCICNLPPGQDRGTQMTGKAGRRDTAPETLFLSVPPFICTRGSCTLVHALPELWVQRTREVRWAVGTTFTMSHSTDEKLGFRAKRGLPSTIQRGRVSAVIQPEVGLLGKLFPNNHVPHHCPEQDWFFLVCGHQDTLCPPLL